MVCVGGGRGGEGVAYLVCLVEGFDQSAFVDEGLAAGTGGGQLDPISGPCWVEPRDLGCLGLDM